MKFFDSSNVEIDLSACTSFLDLKAAMDSAVWFSPDGTISFGVTANNPADDGVGAPPTSMAVITVSNGGCYNWGGVDGWLNHD